MATATTGKRLDMLSSRQKQQLANTGSFTTSKGASYVPNAQDMSAAPAVVDATVIGTPKPAIPAIPTSAGMETADQTVQRAQSMLEGATTPTTVATPEQTRPLDLIKQQISGLYEGGAETSPETIKLQEDAAKANLRLRNLTTQIAAYGKSTKDTLYEMNKNQSGKSAGALQAEMSNFEYERYARPGGAADMAIEAQFAMNNAQYAYEIANNAVAAEDKQYERKRQYFTDLYNMYQNDMTESEQMQYQSKLRMYETQVNNLTESKTLAVQRASAAGADADTLLAIKNATTPEDVWTAAGTYGEDPNIKLARDKFYWDVQYAKQKMALDAQLLQGQIDQKTYNDNKQKETTKKEIGKSVDAVGRILSNSLGLGAATGKVTGRTAGFLDLGTRTGAVGAAGGAAFGPVGAAIGGATAFLAGGFWGAGEARQQQEEIANDMDYIAASLTKQKIGEAKALGLTGTMSDKDIELIGNSADVLVSAWDSENMTFRGDPKKIQEHLTTLQTTLNENIEMLQLEQEFNL